MATVSYKTFLPEVMIGMKSCPEAVAVNAIRNAVIEYCDLSWTWRNNHTLISVDGLTGKYSFAPPANTVVCAILQAWYAGEPLIPKAVDWLNQKYDKWQSETGDPEYYTREDEASVTIVPYPATAAASVLAMLNALKPTRASTTCDSLLHENHLERISMGARSRLMLMPDMPWTEPNLGAAYKTQFEVDAKGQRTMVLKGLVRSRQRVTGVYF